MKQRKLVIGLLVMLAVAVSGFTFAFWAGSVTITQAADETNIITIGEGNTAATTVVISENNTLGTLVPVGKTGDSVGTTVDSILLTFTVDWNSDTAELLAEGAEGALAANVTFTTNPGSLVKTVVRIGGTEPTITTSGATKNLSGTDLTDIVADGDTINVYVLVYMLEPANQQEYADIAGTNVEFDIDFVVSVNATT
jgi:hypothetical protein